MEAQELFRRLGAGARFDVRRFGLDARRFGVRSYRGEGGRCPRRLSGAPGPFPSARWSPARTGGLVAALGILTGSLSGCVTVLLPTSPGDPGKWRPTGEPRLLREQGESPPGVRWEAGGWSGEKGRGDGREEKKDGRKW
mgnify:CR=1 FL=1